MRLHPRTDANQKDIVRGLREAGCSVEPRAACIGGGCPDLLVGYRGANFTLEVKDPSKPPSAQRLTPDEEKWHREWRGQVAVVKTLDDALRVVGILPVANPVP